MHDRSAFLFIKTVFLASNWTFHHQNRGLKKISRRIRATTDVCRHKQLPLPGRQNQQPSLSCIWEILNAGKRVSKLSFKILLAESYLLYMSIKRIWTWN